MKGEALINYFILLILLVVSVILATNQGQGRTQMPNFEMRNYLYLSVVLRRSRTHSTFLGKRVNA